MALSLQHTSPAAHLRMHPHTRHDHGYGAKCAVSVYLCACVGLCTCFSASVWLRVLRVSTALRVARSMFRVAPGSVLLLLVACVSEVSFVGGVTANKVRPKSQ